MQTTNMSYTMMRCLRRTVLLTHQIRVESTMTNLTQEDYVFRPPFTQWSKVIKDAEKIVGYPTSFMNLRWLLSDEFANLAVHIRKIAGSNHPIMKTVKTVLYSEHNNLQPWGLIILLLSKAVAPTTSLHATNVADKQRMLAELVEMIRTGNYIHRGLLNIPPEEREWSMDSLFANKVAILVGDYLIVTANGMVARLKNQDLSFLVATAIRDTSEGEFFGPRDKQNMPLPGKPRDSANDHYRITFDTEPLDVKDMLGLPTREWTVRTLFNGGMLFGRGCQGAMLLADRSVEEQRKAFLFGCHLCLAWQAASDLHRFTSTKKDFSLVSAPVLFGLQRLPNLYNKLDNVQNITQVDYESLKQDILETDAVERTKSLYTENAEKAKSYADLFGDSDAVRTIKRMVKNI